MCWCGSALVVAASQLPCQAAQASQTKARVHLVATGGTIASTNYRSERSQHVGVEALLRAVPALDSIATVSAQQFLNVASSQITPTQWLELSRAIADTLRAHPPARLSGVVVTHGTDSMEETAYFLDLTIQDARPVVVTGAMRPADGVGIDGPANLLNSVRVASDTAARGRGAMVLLNDEIFAARDVTKSNTVRPDAFAAPYRGALGVADPERIVFHRLPARAPVFDVSSVRELPRVDVAYGYGGADGTAIDAFVASGAKGIVIASLGRGSIPPAMREAVNRALEKGVIVVVASRAGSGSVPVGTGVRRGSSAPSTIGSGDLTAQKARILLMLALTRVKTTPEVAAIFQSHQ